MCRSTGPLRSYHGLEYATQHELWWAGRVHLCAHACEACTYPGYFVKACWAESKSLPARLFRCKVATQVAFRRYRQGFCEVKWRPGHPQGDQMSLPARLLRCKVATKVAFWRYRQGFCEVKWRPGYHQGDQMSLPSRLLRRKVSLRGAFTKSSYHKVVTVKVSAQ